MKHFLTLFAFSAFSSMAFAAGPIADIYDGQVKSVENDVVRLATKMPADKYNFAPNAPGEFKGVRTFALQVRHIATVIYQCSAAALGEKPPVDLGKTDNGPDTLKTKEQILDYLKGAVAYAHKAAQNLNEKNQLDDMPNPFNPSGKMKRVAAMGVIGWHSFDHYGQMVVYARMNGVIPGDAPAPAPAKKQ
ncbi:MAG: DinB family protein [Bryobacteraceae bacterium]